MDNIILRKFGGNQAVRSAPHLTTSTPHHCGGSNRASCRSGSCPFLTGTHKTRFLFRFRSKRPFYRKKRRRVIFFFKFKNWRKIYFTEFRVGHSDG
ncbi:hypothetical protein NPIL_331171 [Nephila pilipes]|uniref:Uncharacterized protein n=1 Tax=Nephila pilipes TaxID=299642 RepID=A0A8X6TWU8_NEPPI|nr:hypothetical protein NPIL_682841 [Nephila pilipes]GFT69719.1 hypothetical protein NPIL_523801 [Nephila pilipes]GFT96076.1 hypothetical protein NPIL_518871 [Nephila pilipes]GFU15909.1 hypothetical protein NPIL_331171 [Nephila pilipes]